MLGVLKAHKAVYEWTSFKLDAGLKIVGAKVNTVEESLPFSVQFLTYEKP